MLVALLPLIIRKKAARMAAAIAMGAFVLLTSFSIGVVYLPAGLLMWAAACMDPSANFSDILR